MNMVKKKDRTQARRTGNERSVVFSIKKPKDQSVLAVLGPNRALLSKIRQQCLVSDATVHNRTLVSKIKKRCLRSDTSEKDTTLVSIIRHKRLKWTLGSKIGNQCLKSNSCVHIRSLMLKIGHECLKSDTNVQNHTGVFKIGLLCLNLDNIVIQVSKIRPQSLKLDTGVYFRTMMLKIGHQRQSDTSVFNCTTVTIIGRQSLKSDTSV